MAKNPQKYLLNKGFIYQKLGEKTTIFDGEKSVLLTLNETASIIFAKLKNGWNIEKIAKHIASKYQIRLERVKSDVEACIRDLNDKKIIRRKI